MDLVEIVYMRRFMYTLNILLCCNFSKYSSRNCKITVQNPYSLTVHPRMLCQNHMKFTLDPHRFHSANAAIAKGHLQPDGMIMHP